jgi:hypothetical protein
MTEEITGEWRNYVMNFIIVSSPYCHDNQIKEDEMGG